MDKKNLLYIIYCMIVFVFLVGLFMPFFGYNSWLISSPFSYLVLLSIFGFFLYFIDSSDFWNRLQSFKFGSSGIELTIREVQKLIYEEEREAQPEEIKDELAEIRSPLSRFTTFLNLDTRIREKIENLAQVYEIPFHSTRQVLDDLLRSSAIDATTYSIIASFDRLRNQSTHLYEKTTNDQYEYMFELGERIITRLTHVYVQDVPLERAPSFITQSELKNPKLRYFTWKNKSGSPDHVGIYYTVRAKDEN